MPSTISQNSKHASRFSSTSLPPNAQQCSIASTTRSPIYHKIPPYLTSLVHKTNHLSICSDDNNKEQQQLSTIERLVSARAELEAHAGEVPNMQPLIKKQMDALGRAWPIPVQDTEGKGELGTFFARLRGGPIDKDQHQPRGLDSMKAAQGDKEQHHSQELETMLASMREAQKQEDQEESRKLEDFFTRLRGAQKDEDQQHTRKVDAAIASKLAAQKDNEYHAGGLEAAVARMRVEDQFAELGLFDGFTSSNPPERNHRPTTSPERKSLLLTFAKIGPRDTDYYLSTSGPQYSLLFDAEANSYTVQEVRWLIPVQRSDKLSFHINAIRSVDHQARRGDFLRVDVRLESGKEVNLVFVNLKDRMAFLMNVHCYCPALNQN